MKLHGWGFDLTPYSFIHLSADAVHVQGTLLICSRSRYQHCWAVSLPELNEYEWISDTFCVSLDLFSSVLCTPHFWLNRVSLLFELNAVGLSHKLRSTKMQVFPVQWGHQWFSQTHAVELIKGWVKIPSNQINNLWHSSLRYWITVILNYESPPFFGGGGGKTTFSTVKTMIDLPQMYKPQINTKNKTLVLQEHILYWPTLLWHLLYSNGTSKVFYGLKVYRGNPCTT